MTKLAVLVSSEDVQKRVDADQGARQVLALTGQDSLSRVTRVVSDYSAEWATQAVGRDPFTDDTGTGYGGMKYMAGLEGSWKASEGIMTLVSSMHRSIAEYVPIIDTLNGSAQMAFMLNDADKKEYGGIAFRILDKDNYFFVFYDVESDKIQLCRNVTGGADTVYATSAAMSWRTVNTWRWLRVELRYAICTVLTSTDGITWNVLSWDSGDGELPGMLAVVDGESYTDWSGKIGVIGKGYSNIDAPPVVDLDPWPEPTPVPIPVGSGLADASEIWFATSSAIYYSGDFSFSLASAPTYASVPLPAGLYEIDRFAVTLSGSAIYVVGKVSSVRGLWYSANPRDADPTWVNIINVGDSFHGGTVNNSWAFHTLIPYGDTVSTRLDYLSGTWHIYHVTYTGTTPSEVYLNSMNGVLRAGYTAEAFIASRVGGGEDLRLLNGTYVGPFITNDGRASSPWHNLIGGHWYGFTYDSDTLWDLWDISAGTVRVENVGGPARGNEGYNSILAPRGAWRGSEINFTDGTGHFWQAADGVTFEKKTTTPWAWGFVEQSKLAGGGPLVWMSRSFLQSAEIIRVSLDNGVTWSSTDRGGDGLAGNFWNLPGVSGSQIIVNMQLVY
jgi:hypothetical protein